MLNKFQTQKILLFTTIFIVSFFGFIKSTFLNYTKVSRHQSLVEEQKKIISNLDQIIANSKLESVNSNNFIITELNQLKANKVKLQEVHKEYKKAINQANIYLFLACCGLIIISSIDHFVKQSLVDILKQSRQAEKNFQEKNQQLENRAQELSQLLEQIKITEEEQRKGKEQLQIKLVKLQQELLPVNQGNLSVRATVTEDEIGNLAKSYNQTLENLSRIIFQFQEVTKTVTKTTNSNEEEVIQLSNDALKQTQAITSVLEEVQKMAESIGMVSDNAAKAENSIKKATERVKQGDITINATVDRIVALQESTAAAKEQVKKLAKASSKISKAVDLIRKIALQTNVLAVNASIEAARAGEEGMGFTVVAEEVQTLATQSAKTATDIEKLVLEIQTETNKVIKVMDQSNQEIMAGSKLMKETRLSLQQITEASSEIDLLIEEINRVAKEQSQKSQTVTSTMEKVVAIANQTSVSATDVSTSFKNLLQVASNLETSINQFKV